MQPSALRPGAARPRRPFDCQPASQPAGQPRSHPSRAEQEPWSHRNIGTPCHHPHPLRAAPLRLLALAPHWPLARGRGVPVLEPAKTPSVPTVCAPPPRPAPAPAPAPDHAACPSALCAPCPGPPRPLGPSAPAASPAATVHPLRLCASLESDSASGPAGAAGPAASGLVAWKNASPVIPRRFGQISRINYCHVISAPGYRRSERSGCSACGERGARRAREGEAT